MNTSTRIENKPVIQSDRLADEVAMREACVVKLEASLVAARASAIQASRDVEAAEDRLIMGEIAPSTLADFRNRSALADAAVPRLLGELSVERRLLGKARHALEGLRIHEGQDQQKRVRHQVCAIVAPLLEAGIAAYNAARTLPGFSVQFQAWCHGLQIDESRSPSSRFFGSALSAVLQESFSGDVAFFADLLRDFQSAAPELFSPEMEAFLNQCGRELNERIGRQQREAERVARASRGPAQMLAAVARENVLAHFGRVRMTET